MKKLSKQKFRWANCGSALEVRQQIREWYRNFPGQWLQQEEKKILEQVLPNLFGYNILQVGLQYDSDCLFCSRIPYRIILDVDLHREGELLLIDKGKNTVFVGGLPETLPVLSDSLDVIVLSHTLEFSNNPHELLREIERTLIPEGHVVILGFNPWGIWMLWKIVLGWTKKTPWCGRFARQSRVRDWLQLLGFDITESHSYFFRPPLTQVRLMRRLRLLEKLGPRWWPFFSGAYAIVAKKRVTALTPLKPRWKPKRSRLVSAGLAGNSNTTHQNNVRRNR